MKRSLAIFVCMIVLTGTGFSQSALQWVTNYASATAAAKKESKPILLFFHGSDWCPPCIKMQQQVFADSSFIALAKSKVIFLDIDFRRKPALSAAQLKHNQAVKKQFGLPDDFTQGYPQVVIIDATGKVLYQEKGYEGEGPTKLAGIINAVTDKLR